MLQFHLYYYQVSRSLYFEVWKKENPEKDDQKYAQYWRKLKAEEMQVCRSTPSHLILSDTSNDLDQLYEDRAKEIVRHRCPRHLSRHLSNVAFIQNSN